MDSNPMAPADVHLEGGLGPGGRATHHGAIVKREPAGVAGALDAAVDELALVRRRAAVGSPVV